MLGSISPVGEAARRQRWWLTAGAYAAGSLVGGATVGGALAATGWLLVEATGLTPGIRIVLLAVIVAAAGLVDSGLVRLPLPTWHRQVDERWLDSYRGWVYGAGFGLQLGSGVATIVPAAVTYAALGAALLSADWRHGLVIGVAFAAVRALPLLLAGAVRTAAQLYTVTRRVAAAEPLAHRLVVGAELGAATVALLTASRLVT